jgi:hypothetical protein
MQHNPYRHGSMELGTKTGSWRRAPSVVLTVVAILGVSQCTVHHRRHASATVLMIGPTTPPTTGLSPACPAICLIPNAVTNTSVADVLVTATHSERFLHEVVAGGGSASFDVRAAGAGLDIHTSSSSRDAANATLTVVIDLLAQRLAALQKESGTRDTLQLRTVRRSDA